MKKLIYILLLIPFIGFGQNIKKIPRGAINNSRATGRINESITQGNQSVLRIDSSKVIFNYETGVADTDSIATDAIIYTDTYWDDLRVPLQNTKLNPTKSEPAFEEIGSTGLYAYAFDSGNDDDESLHFAAQVPHSWAVGTDLEFHVHWYPDNTNTGNVVFELDYIAVGINGTMGAVQTIEATIAADGTAFKHQVDDIGEVSATGLTISSMIICRFTRLGDDAADTFTGNVLTNEVDFHFEIDNPGSEEEYVKY